LAFELSPENRTRLTILIATPGYFVDLFDLILFTLVRVQSLKDLGVAPADMLATGANLISWQMAGVMTGGNFRGVRPLRIGLNGRAAVPPRINSCRGVPSTSKGARCRSFRQDAQNAQRLPGSR
jgi:hypothetical protein